MTWVEREESWHRVEVQYCEVTGQLLPRRHWEFEHEGRIIRARDPRCETLYRKYILPRRDAEERSEAPSETGAAEDGQRPAGRS